MKTDIALFLRALPSNLAYLGKYTRGAQKMVDHSEIRERLFARLVDESNDKNCLQVGVRRQKFGPHWICVDLFDKSPLVDYHYDIQDLGFRENTFDIVVCNAVLEHVECPQKAIGELHRVLKNDGLIWVEVPLNQPYHPSPNDYWRVTPEGIRVWMKAFKENSSGSFRAKGSTIYNGVYFFGAKKA